MPDPYSREATAPAETLALPTVYIVDDDISVRESLKALVRLDGHNVMTFESASDLLSCPRMASGCIVLDVSLPGLNGLALQEQLNSDRAPLPIIFITGHSDVPTTVRAMKAGAIEFMTKPLNSDALLDAIADAIERSVASRAKWTELQALRAQYEALSRREREVMALIAAGLLNKQVGGKLGISEVTVKAHRGQVMRKMHARSLAELLQMALRLDISRSTQA